MRICPVCAGVSGTWIWILAGMFSGVLDAGRWQLFVAMLMGGTVVGIAYQIEKRLPPHRSPLLRKTLFIPAGFALVYGVLAQWWNAALVSFAFLLLLSFVFFASQRKIKDSDKTTKELEEKMKDCC
ncbi:hypothetical protein KGQ34_00675 [Patescibacteria group bacterium]|nr:hypothetical protein [Patescibacteria group bacterium]